MKKIYVIRNFKIFEGEITKITKRGTAAHVRFNGLKKTKLAGFNNIFETYNEAEKELIDRITQKKLKKQKEEERLKREMEKVDKIMNKIRKEFGVEVRFLDKPATEEEAYKMYYKIKRDR